MAFVRRKVKTFQWPVTVHEPKDGGGFTESTFTATFKRLDRSEMQALAEKPVVDLIKAVLTDWDGINDEANKPIPFNANTLAEQLEDSDWVRGVMAAFDATYETQRQGN